MLVLRVVVVGMRGEGWACCIVLNSCGIGGRVMFRRGRRDGDKAFLVMVAGSWWRVG